MPASEITSIFGPECSASGLLMGVANFCYHLRTRLAFQYRGPHGVSNRNSNRPAPGLFLVRRDGATASRGAGGSFLFRAGDLVLAQVFDARLWSCLAGPLPVRRRSSRGVPE